MIEPILPADTSYTARFAEYLSRDLALEAARSLREGAEMQFHVLTLSGHEEIFTYYRMDDRNFVRAGKAEKPQVSFQVPAAAAEIVLNYPKDSIGETGLQILKLIFDDDPARRVDARVHAGFLTFFSLGYFGVLRAGGSVVSSFLSSQGLSGVDAIKRILKKIRQKKGMPS